MGCWPMGYLTQKKIVVPSMGRAAFVGIILKEGLITMFLRWVRTPLMPGIGCLGKFYIRCPGIQKIGIFRFPEIRIFGDSEVRKSENRDFRIPGHPEFRKSDF